jgi:hypothetical protein
VETKPCELEVFGYELNFQDSISIRINADFIGGGTIVHSSWLGWHNKYCVNRPAPQPHQAADPTLRVMHCAWHILSEKDKMYDVRFNPLKPRLVQILFEDSVRISKRAQHFTITKINCLILFKETTPVYSDNDKKLRNIKRKAADC